MFSWLNFLTYAMVTAITPGPNNIMSMSNAGRLGFFKSLPFNFGIFTGFCIVVSLCTIFSTTLSVLIPIIELPMLLIGVAYIMYLAWKTYKSDNSIQETSMRSDFFSGLTLQFVNPKLYLYSIISMDAYIFPHYGDNMWALAAFALLLSFIGFICTVLWSGFGSIFKLIFSKYQKITNTIMALLLVYCALNLLLSHLSTLNMKFFLMFTLVLLIGCLYVSLRLIPRTSLYGWKKYMAYVLCFTPIINIPVRYHVRTMASVGENVPPWLDMTLFGTYILIGALSIFATVIFITDLILFTKWIIARIQKKENKNIEPTNNIPDVSRRIFIQNSISAGIVAVGSGLVGFGMNEAIGVPEVKHVPVVIKNLPPEFNGFRIVQLTDLHVNMPAPISRMEKIVEEVNRLKADAVVVTGDLSDSYPSKVHAAMEPMRALEAKHGKYFVSGNHEYYTGIEVWLEEVERLELTNLHNEHKAIERQGKRLLMCGVPDIQAPRMSSHISDPILAQANSKEEDIKILLSHQPQSIYKAIKVGYHLQISGHTHGGQLFPWTYVTDLVQPYIHGLYEVENTKLYVSRGTGYWGPPLRIGAPPEITFLELVGA